MGGHLLRRDHSDETVDDGVRLVDVVHRAVGLAAHLVRVRVRVRVRG